MPNLDPIRQKYILDTTSMVRAHGRAGASGKRLNFVMRELNGAMRLAVRRAGAAAFAAFGATLFFASKAANKFGKELAEVATLVDTSKVSILAFRKELLSLAKVTPLALSDLTKGLYQTISAAIPAANAVQFLGVASKAAVAGVTTVATAVNGMTSVLNAWAMSTDEATDIADTFFVTVRDGKTTFEELANNIGTVAPMAAGMGASFEEVSAAIAAMTLQGLGTDKAAVAMRGFFNSLLRPTKEAADLARQLGIEWNESSISAKGFVPFMEELRKKTGGNSRAIAILVGNVRAANGVSALLKNGFDDLVRVMGDMETKVGAMETAFDKMRASSESTWKLFKNNLNVVLISLGEKILPAVNSALSTMIDWFSKLSGTEVDRAIDKLRALGLEFENLSKFQAVLLKENIRSSLQAVGSVRTGPFQSGTRTQKGQTYQRKGGSFATPDLQIPYVSAQGKLDLTKYLDAPIAGVKAITALMEDLQDEASPLDAALAKVQSRLFELKRNRPSEANSELISAAMTEKKRLDMLLNAIIANEDLLKLYKEQFEQMSALDNVIAGVEPATGVPPLLDDVDIDGGVDNTAKIDAANEAFKEYARSVALLRAETDGEREALENLFEKQDEFNAISEAYSVISTDLTAARNGEKEAIEELATAYSDLQDVRRDPDASDKEREAAEEEVKARLKSFEISQQDVLTQRERFLAETKLLGTAKERLAAAELGVKLGFLTVKQLQEIKKLEDGLAKVSKKIEAPFSDLLRTVEDIVRLFSFLGDDMQNLVRGGIQLAQAMETIDGLKTTDALGNVSGGLGDFSSMASIIPQVQLAGAVAAIGTELLGGLFGGGPSAEELARAQEEQADRLKKNTEALEEVTRTFGDIALALLRQTTPGAGLDPNLTRTAIGMGRQVLSDQFEPVGLRESLKNLGLTDEQTNLIEGGERDPSDFLTEGQLADLGVSYNGGFSLEGDRLAQLLGLPTPDEMIAAMEALGGSYEDFGDRVKDIIDDTGVSLNDAIKQALRETIPTLEQLNEIGLGTTGTTVAGVRQQVSLGQQFLGEEGEESFNRLVSGLGGLESLPKGLREEIAGLDFSDQKGLQAFIEKLITERLAGETPVSADIADSIAEAMQEFVVDSDTDGISRSVQIARTITEIQANELIAIQETALLTLERILEATKNSKSGRTYQISISMSQDVDNVGRLVMEQIENEIALKEAS